MARIRTIKPEFWSSPQVTACSHLARLTFIGLLNFCDDGGVHQDSCERLMMVVFPDGSCPVETVTNSINELIKNELVSEFEADGKKYWFVTGFNKHQRIDKPTYRHPKPPCITKGAVKTSSSNNTRYQEEHSHTTSRDIVEVYATERNGKECNVKEEIYSEVDFSTSRQFQIEVSEIFSYWKATLNHPKAKLDDKRSRSIKNAIIKLGYSVEEIKQAIDGCSLSPFHLGQNDEGKRYDDITLILRDATKVESFIDMSQRPPSSNPGEFEYMDFPSPEMAIQQALNKDFSAHPVVKTAFDEAAMKMGGVSNLKRAKEKETLKVFTPIYQEKIHFYRVNAEVNKNAK